MNEIFAKQKPDEFRVLKRKLMTSRSKKIKVDSFDFADYHAKRLYPKSKTPLCDFMENYPGDMCPDSPVISLDYAQQLEYNWRYYERKYKAEKRKNKSRKV